MPNLKAKFGFRRLRHRKGEIKSQKKIGAFGAEKSLKAKFGF